MSEREARKKRYLERDGVVCLFCGDSNIEADAMEYDVLTTQKVRCLKCRRSWTDILGVVNVVEDDKCAHTKGE